MDAITLPAEQKTLAEGRIREEGFADKITIHICDYRELPKSFERSFDACISCEMLEVREFWFLPLVLARN